MEADSNDTNDSSHDDQPNTGEYDVSVVCMFIRFGN